MTHPGMLPPMELCQKLLANHHDAAGRPTKQRTKAQVRKPDADPYSPKKSTGKKIKMPNQGAQMEQVPGFACGPTKNFVPSLSVGMAKVADHHAKTNAKQGIKGPSSSLLPGGGRGNPVKTLTCHRCNILVVGPNAVKEMDKHLKTCGMIECVLCGKSYKTIQNLQAHQMKTHM